MKKRVNYGLLSKLRYIVVFMVCMTLCTGFVFGQDGNVTPRLAFNVNNNEMMAFDNATGEPLYSRAVATPINVNGVAYVPISVFSEILGYTLGHNEISKTITLAKGDKVVEYTSINISDDLQKANMYFNLSGTTYVKVEEFALLEGLKIAQKNGTYLLYEQASQSEVNNQNQDFFYAQDGQILISDKLVQRLGTGLTFGDDNHIEIVKGTYDGTSYNGTSYNGASYDEPFINPYVPYSYDQMVVDIDKLKTQYPEYIKVGSAGNSVEGRSLFTMEFGNGPKHIYLFGSHHAREYISTTYIMKFVNEMAYAAKSGINNTGYDVNNILNNVTYHIIPMVNPDGVNLVQNGIESVSPEYREQVRSMRFNEGAQYGFKAWKSNIRGVDINRNYPVAWEKMKNIKGPASSNYPGPYSASEPETQAVINYLTLYKPEMVVSMHTQGQVIYWSSPNDNAGEVGRKMFKVSGFGPIAENRSKQDGGYLSNYIMTTYNAYEITIELCKYTGPYPYPDAQFDTVWAPSKDLLLIIGDEIGKTP